MSDYFNVTTNVGDAAIATAIASNSKLNITHIAFGDGNGSVPTPTKTRTGLVKEVHRQAVTKYTMHPTIANYIVIETIIPSNIGGFWIREMGIIADNVLISHGSHAPFFKVADPEGVSEYRLKFTQNVRDGNVVEISLDESLIYASQAWVEENFIKRNDIADNLTTDDATKPASARTVKVLNDSLNILNYCPIAYPKSTPPAGYLAMMGQAISQVTYPKLYALYGANLPDMRAYTIRGLDNGRGIDLNRVVLTEQGDAIRNITGRSAGIHLSQFVVSGGTGALALVSSGEGGTGASTNGVIRSAIELDASKVVPTAPENRVKNIAFLYIVKAD
ncbi:phage tail protein [Acinetobacter johnsonii]|uniref:phage tail protein n=1 Tax=Acinetobacter johnsonii TaxID=40214 RepID=UPI002936269D|nr:phage tail protein [Acinetobacter johnsonii]MDV2486357.1 phage tail protein [Acinetobacter johnsonii]